MNLHKITSVRKDIKGIHLNEKIQEEITFFYKKNKEAKNPFMHIAGMLDKSFVPHTGMYSTLY